MSEYVRQALSRSICGPLKNEKGEILLFVLGRELEEKFNMDGEGPAAGGFSPALLNELMEKLKKTIEGAGPLSHHILMTPPRLRRTVKMLTDKFFPTLIVLSHSEIPDNINVVSLGVI